MSPNADSDQTKITKSQETNGPAARLELSPSDLSPSDLSPSDLFPPSLPHPQRQTRVVKECVHDFALANMPKICSDFDKKNRQLVRVIELATDS